MQKSPEGPVPLVLYALHGLSKSGRWLPDKLVVPFFGDEGVGTAVLPEGASEGKTYIEGARREKKDSSSYLLSMIGHHQFWCSSVGCSQ